MTSINQPVSPLSPDDPRITAYALDGMTPDERVAFEAVLATDPAAQAEVDAVLELGSDLTSLFVDVPAPALSEPQRAAVLSASAPSASSAARSNLERFIGLVAAAAVLFVVGSVVVMAKSIRPGGRALRNSETASVNGPVPPLGDSTAADQDARTRAAFEHVAHRIGDLSKVVGYNNDTILDDGHSSAPVNSGEAWCRVEVPGHYFVNENDMRVSGGVRSRARAKAFGDMLTVTGFSGTPPLTSEDGFAGFGSGAYKTAGGGGGHSGPLGSSLYEVTPVPAPVAASGGYRYVPDSGPRVDPALPVNGMNGTAVKMVDGYVNRVGVVTRGLPRPVFGRIPPSTIPPSTGTPSQPGESYQPLVDNAFQNTKDNHTSTFSIDVDTASYANVRRMLLAQGMLPPRDAVRIEEFINAFDYDYAKPGADAPHPIAMQGDVSGCPWNPEHRLARIALQAHDVGDKRPALNLVFLVDVSGSMRSNEKLPLVKRGLSMLLEQMRPGDRIGIVTYASNAGVRLVSTDAAEPDAIQAAIDGLSAGGSTNGAGGIYLAYDMARKHFAKDAANRVILATDGDFNVGETDNSKLEALIAKQAKEGIDLSVLGFGMGNYKDERLERLSNRGNGNYAYIDGVDEARKALVTDMLGTLVTVAKDVKFQLFFNPQKVRSWRLIGYANRLLAARDFNDDRKDAGEVGSGHCVTALYEIVPVGAKAPRKAVDPNPYVAPKAPKAEPVAPVVASDALFTLRLRYKALQADKSTLVETEVLDGGSSFDKSDDDFRWATAVAGFGMLLRGSAHVGGLSLAAIEEIAKATAGENNADRAKFVEMVQRARVLRGR